MKMFTDIVYLSGCKQYLIHNWLVLDVFSTASKLDTKKRVRERVCESRC